MLVAAGHGEPEVRASKKPQHPGGLFRREVDVLHLAARGPTTRKIVDRLFIPAKTADHHIQHIYNKIGAPASAGVGVVCGLVMSSVVYQQQRHQPVGATVAPVLFFPHRRSERDADQQSFG